MEIDRKDTNIQIGKRLREARTNMNKDKAEFAASWKPGQLGCLLTRY